MAQLKVWFKSLSGMLHNLPNLVSMLYYLVKACSEAFIIGTRKQFLNMPPNFSDNSLYCLCSILCLLFSKDREQERAAELFLAIFNCQADQELADDIVLVPKPENVHVNTSGQDSQ